MIGSDTIRGYNEAIILRILLSGDNYGYDISRRVMEDSKGLYSMKETTLYAAFTRMEKNGHVTAYSGDVTFGKPRTYYHITEAGVAYYQSKCEEWDYAKKALDYFMGGLQ
ncbi:MAG: PadR family transcriptional regulator [Eubacteriales bacterium]|nr:PadR family transcriptional regulator [Eubacteriales bacterium]